MWLTNLNDHVVLAAASTSFRPIVRSYAPQIIDVAHAACAAGADIIYLHARRATPPIIAELSTFHLTCVPVGAVAPLPLVDIACAAAMAPVLLERRGESITRFYGRNGSENACFEKEQEVDERIAWDRIIAWLTRVYLPTGFPHTTTPDYMSFTKYRTLQNLASAIMSVISTEALLFGLGLGKTVAAGAAATSWVLKDGASYIVKILYGSMFGSKFDDDPKSWRIAADIVEDVGGAIEILTPLFPMSYFLPLASMAVCLRGMSLMTGTATRHVVYRSLAASGIQNTGDIATKGESQGVTMKMIGLGAGIVISSRIGQNYYALLVAYGVLAAVHIAANWKSVQCVQFSFFNKQRASILIENHLNGLPILTPYQVSSVEKVVLPPWRGFEPAVKIGVGVKEAVSTPQLLNDAISRFQGERFLIFTHNRGRNVSVLLRDNAQSTDALRAYYTVKKYMKSSDRSPQALEQSFKFMKRHVRTFEKEATKAGWDMRHMLLTDGLTRVSW